MPAPVNFERGHRSAAHPRCWADLRGRRQMAYVEREGCRIGFDVIGDGPAVVLLHSFLCSGEMWRGQVGPLAAGYRVINIDCRGHGASSPVSKAFTLYDLMDDAFAVLDALCVDLRNGCIARSASRTSSAEVSGVDRYRRGVRRAVKSAEVQGTRSVRTR